MFGRAQPRRRTRVAIALATICILVTGGVLARHHEADVAHVTDAHTGVTSHALETNCHNGAPTSHLHALPDSDQHADVCALTAALHQPTRISHPAPLVSPAISIERATAPPVAIHTQTSLLLSAPKTSPPLA
jgi:hypothetical protein